MKSTPKPLHVSRAAVEQAAETFAAATGFRPGQPLISLITRLGGKLVYGTPSGPETPARLTARSISDFEIHLPVYTSDCFNRMAIATGLGFLVLHLPGAGDNMPLFAPRWPADDDADAIHADREALRFAYALLMPQAAFSAAWRSAAGNAKTVAVSFGVSERVAQLRAQTLDLVHARAA